MPSRTLRQDFWLVLATAVAVSFCVGVLQGQPSTPVPLLPNGIVPPSVCGTRAESHLTGAIAPAAAIADGEPLFFEQDPPLVFPNHSGPIVLRNFNIVGDYPTVDFY